MAEVGLQRQPQQLGPLVRDDDGGDHRIDEEVLSVPPRDALVVSDQWPDGIAHLEAVTLELLMPVLVGLAVDVVQPLLPWHRGREQHCYGSVPGNRLDVGIRRFFRQVLCSLQGDDEVELLDRR